MHVHFNPDSDAAPWPGPQALSGARAGEEWVGPGGLLRMLEAALGLSAPQNPDPVRAAALARSLREREGFWSRSVENHPFDAATVLLDVRDALRLAGWRGQPASERLGQLASATQDVMPGVPDRIEAVTSELVTRDPGLERIVVYAPPEEIDPAWATVLEALRRRGAAVEHVGIGEARASGNLQAARSAAFRPAAGDDSLQIVRPASPSAAAECTAAWLSAQGDLGGTVIVGPDALLDQALVRFGLPATGGFTGPENALLQVLPLSLAMGWWPPDPRRALELLLLESGPVPRAIARKLAEKLRKSPAVDSDLWREALDEGLNGFDDPSRRRAVAERLRVLFGIRTEVGGYQASAARDKAGSLVRWMQAAKGREGSDAQAFDAAIAQCLNFGRLLDLSGLDVVSEAQLLRLVSDAGGTVASPPRFRAEAGLASVPGPEALLGEAGQIVWWDFTRERTDLSLPTLYRFLAPIERSRLREMGVALPDPGEEALRRAARWRRPLLLARQRLVLVSPRTGVDGEASSPHPLWDEVVAKVPGGRAGLLRHVEHREPAGGQAPLSAAPPPLATPGARLDWHVLAGSVAARAQESPSGLRMLIGCPFAWTVQYAARTGRGFSTDLQEGDSLIGEVAHAIVGRVLATDPLPEADEAAAMAVQIFESDGPRMAADLFRQGMAAEKLRLRAVLGDSTRDLVRWIRDNGLRVAGVEVARRGDVDGTPLEGRLDCLLGEPPLVLDLKWSSGNYRRDELREGRALQLAAYAHVVGGGREDGAVRTAYYILSSRRLLTVAALRGAETVEGPALGETWAGAVEAVRVKRAELGQGVVQASGLLDDAVLKEIMKAPLADGLLRLKAECCFCEYGALCGKAWRTRDAVAEND